MQFLAENEIVFEQKKHPAATTCEQSAQFRGTSLHIGGKTIMLKDKTAFRLFVLPANKELDNNKARKILKSQKLRFATTSELADECGVEKGALPPFGRPLFPFDLYVDPLVLENELIAFNAGILTHSIIMRVSEYQKLITPTLCNFSK